MDIETYANIVFAGGIKSSYFPMDGLTFYKGIAGGTIARQGQFQVQMFWMAPHTEVPDHIHPDVDSIEVYLAGQMIFRKNGEVLVPEKDALATKNGGTQPLHAGMTIRIKPDDVHGATILGAGGAFLSVQKWLNGKIPDTITNNWEGHNLVK